MNDKKCFERFFMQYGINFSSIEPDPNSSDAIDILSISKLQVGAFTFSFDQNGIYLSLIQTEEIEETPFKAYKYQMIDSDESGWTTPTKDAKLYISKGRFFALLDEQEIVELAKTMEANFRR